MNEGLWVPVVLFIVTGFCTIGFFYFNHKNSTAIMEFTGQAGRRHQPQNSRYASRRCIVVARHRRLNVQHVFCRSRCSVGYSSGFCVPFDDGSGVPARLETQQGLVKQ